MPVPEPADRQPTLKKGAIVVVRTNDGYMSEGTVLAVFTMQHGTKVRVRCDHRVVMVDESQIIEVKQ